MASSDPKSWMTGATPACSKTRALVLISAARPESEKWILSKMIWAQRISALGGPREEQFFLENDVGNEGAFHGPSHEGAVYLAP